MPFQRHVRLVASAAVLVGVVTFGLADWSASASPGYVVKAGDSLWSIATARHLTVNQLAAANHLDPAAILPIGLHLILPSPSAQVASASAYPAPRKTMSTGAFCGNFSSDPGPYGVLPSQLAGTSKYYRLAPLFRHWAAHYDLSLSLLEAVAWQESGWQQGVVSVTGAVGIGQIEPYTATFIMNDLVGEQLNINSASDNIRMSAALLAHLADIEGNSQCATIAAYYEGALNLQSIGVLPDTQQYVADVEALVPRFE